MELNGYVQNGVIVLSGGATLPEGTPVTVTCGDAAIKEFVKFPLVDSGEPGIVKLDNDRIAEIFEQEDIEFARRFMQPAEYDDSPWTDEERDAMRAEALDDLGWEGMEAYQDEEK